MPAASSERHEQALLNIGQVVELLRPDHPDVTISRIRHWEDEGLVKPERTPAGYRKFTYADVDRLRYVLRMKRDHYLPLNVIREHLDAIDRGLEPPQLDPVVPTVPRVALAADGLPAPESFRRTDRFRLSRKELLKIAEVDEELLGAARGLRPGEPHGDRPLRHRRADRRADRPRARRLRSRAAPPAGRQDRRRPRGRPRGAGGRARTPRARRRRGGPGGGGRQRDRGPLGAAPRDPREDRPARDLILHPGSRVGACARWT
ncbi:MerR family transcriptional regulator [Nocardioides sp. TF02-7]|uniref:transcriptional regulator FtsR n=1 Tax=Nocardioides sp. TF02-7 TaxID=2917724 RepID=UPI001F0711A2|nr:MerR family transcriptional regulator [Nocardioides sp. TF02-7]UMG92546.1 MerR family transcriptional regulator [Nocardioides sp. TF02-7]